MSNNNEFKRKLKELEANLKNAKVQNELKKCNLNLDDLEQVIQYYYKNAEQFMMAQKAKLFADDEIFQKILQASHPKEVKALGRLVKNYQEDLWQQHRFEIVVQGNLAKFSQNAELKQFLLGTGKRVLVEASPVDKIWGIGLATDDENAEKPLQWKGLNLLGFALMQVRNQLILS